MMTTPNRSRSPASSMFSPTHTFLSVVTRGLATNDEHPGLRMPAPGVSAARMSSFFELSPIAAARLSISVRMLLALTVRNIRDSSTILRVM